MAASSQIGRLGGLGSVAHAPVSQSAERVGRSRRKQAALPPLLTQRAVRPAPSLPPQNGTKHLLGHLDSSCSQQGHYGLGISSFTGLAVKPGNSHKKVLHRRGPVVHVVDEAGVADEQDRGEQHEEPVSAFSKDMMVPTSMAKIGHQFGGGSATLEKGKLDLSREAKTATPKVGLVWSLLRFYSAGADCKRGQAFSCAYGLPESIFL